MPLLAGAWAGWRLEAPDGTGRPERVGLGARRARWPVPAVGVLVAISGGGVGGAAPGRRRPPTWTPLLVAVPVLALGGALGQALTHYRDVRAGHDAPEDARLVVLVSGSGTNLQALLDATADPAYARRSWPSAPTGPTSRGSAAPSATRCRPSSSR